MRLKSPGGKLNKKREKGQWLVPGCLGVGIGEVMRILPSDVAACEVRGGTVLEAQREGAVSCARPPGVVKMAAQRDQFGLIAQRLW